MCGHRPDLLSAVLNINSREDLLCLDGRNHTSRDGSLFNYL